MSDKKLNILTNILGLVFWVLSVYEYFNGKDYKIILFMVVIGSILLYFKSRETKTWLRKLINKKIEQ